MENSPVFNNRNEQFYGRLYSMASDWIPCFKRFFKLYVFTECILQFSLPKYFSFYSLAHYQTRCHPLHSQTKDKYERNRVQILTTKVGFIRPGPQFIPWTNLEKISGLLSPVQGNVNLFQSVSLREALMKRTGYNFNSYCYCYNDSAFHLKGVFLLNKIGRQQMSKSYKCPCRGSQSLFKVLPFKTKRVD